MTKEELKKEAEEWLCNNLHSASEEDFIKAMVDIAEPREKQIQIDAEQIRALQKQNGELTDELTKKANTNHQLIEQMAELTDRVQELEAQIEKMKNCRNCKRFMIEGVCGHFLQVGWCKNWELAD